jgi:hypothetical protein
VVTVNHSSYNGYYYRIKDRRAPNPLDLGCYTLVCVYGPEDSVGEEAIVRGSMLREVSSDDIDMML